jgi:hypothetical protein
MLHHDKDPEQALSQQHEPVEPSLLVAQASSKTNKPKELK